MLKPEIIKKLNSPAYFIGKIYPQNPCVNCLQYYNPDEDLLDIEYVITAPEGELRWWHWKMIAHNKGHGCHDRIELEDNDD